MKLKFVCGARVLLGLIFLVFGLNGFFQFLPMPEMPEAAGAFLGGLAGSGYFFPMLKIVEITSGVLLVTNFFTPLALVLLAPIIVNIIAFHAFLAPSGLGLPIVILVLEIFLVHAYWLFFKGMLTKKAKVHE